MTPVDFGGFFNTLFTTIRITTMFISPICATKINLSPTSGIRSDEYSATRGNWGRGPLLFSGGAASEETSESLNEQELLTHWRPVQVCVSVVSELLANSVFGRPCDVSVRDPWRSKGTVGGIKVRTERRWRRRRQTVSRQPVMSQQPPRGKFAVSAALVYQRDSLVRTSRGWARGWGGGGGSG